MPTLHLSIDEYDHMVRVGAFDAIDRKIELIRGELVEMNPAGPIHGDLIIFLTNWSAQHCDPKVTLISSQTDLELRSQQSRPEPDLTWLRKARYRTAHPQATDVQLAIEVADSSLIRDLEDKRKLYAEAGIVEYWVVDAQANCIHVNRHPVAGDYTARHVYKSPETIAPAIRPTALLPLADLFDEP